MKKNFKLSKIQSVFFGVLVAVAMVSCDKEGDAPSQEPELEFTQEELAEMAAVDRFAAANSVYRALGLLNELPDNWEGTVYEPQVGVAVDEANTDVRNVISTGADHAKSYFLSIVPDLGLEGDSWSHEGVGTLTYRTVNEPNCYAVIDVNLVQMPGLKQLRFVPEEVVGENSFSGDPYYSAGDIVKDKKGILWICVRPSGGPLKKDNAYFVSFDKSLIKTVKQKQDIYQLKDGKISKEKINGKSGEWTYAKNLVEERIALATAHTFAMLFGVPRSAKESAFENPTFASDYYYGFKTQYNMVVPYIDVAYLLMNYTEVHSFQNQNAFAVAYGSYVKNKATKLRQEKYLQPFLVLMHDGRMSEGGDKMLETVIKCWGDPDKDGEISSMPYSLTTDYDPLSYEYFSGIKINYYKADYWDMPDEEYFDKAGDNDFDGKYGYGIRGAFDIMNYASDVNTEDLLPSTHEYTHMKGYLNDYVMVLTQTSVKDNGKPYKDFTDVVHNGKHQWRYWTSLEETERLVYGDGKAVIEKNIYE